MFSMYSSRAVATSSKEAACKKPVHCPRLVIQESFQPYNFAAAADPLLRDSRDMTDNFFTLDCPDTNKNSAIHYIIAVSHLNRPMEIQQAVCCSCTHVLRASLGRRA